LIRINQKIDEKIFWGGGVLPRVLLTSTEKKNFDKLTDNEQSIYKMTFTQLSFNDSAQEEFLSDFRGLVTKLSLAKLVAKKPGIMSIIKK